MQLENNLKKREPFSSTQRDPRRIFMNPSVNVYSHLDKPVDIQPVLLNI